MGRFIYEFGRGGTLFRQNGVTIEDALGHYIAGEPEFVPWWPINWFYFALYTPFYMGRLAWRKVRAKFRQVKEEL